MSPKLSLCSCFGWCRECSRKRRTRSRSLIPSGRRRGDSQHLHDIEDFSEDEDDVDDIENSSDNNARYSAFDSPLFRRNSAPRDPDSSLERVDGGERRGSLPLVSTYNESMESVSTTSRLANFFSKKGFKSNLKRTKSATKLDRKRSSPNLSEQESNDTSLINARIRSSRSHESLLASPPSMHSIDLSAPDVEVKPLHSSVLGQGHCFHVATSQGSKYISCTTSEERDKWLSSLRRTIRPNEEHSKRSDSSLKLWIVEAKNVPAKKRYFCDILLDKTLYAQTSIKTMTDMLFWGEHFEFKNLPAVDILTINLYREADKKKKKDRNTLVGYINLSISDFDNRQLIEKWITCNSGTVGKAGKETKSELPIIRLKARRQIVDILPLDAYQSFIKYLTTDYKQLCQNLEPLLAVREKEDFATSLVYILQKQGKACDFLSDIVMEEISRLDDEHLTFRGNSIATKAMEAYMKLVGEKYLQDTLGDFIRQLIQSPDDCEVDPTKVANPQFLTCQQENLDMYCGMAWAKVINSFCFFPNELREVFASFRSCCNDRGKGDYSDNLISGCIFLRFLCPAILYPSLFNLTQEYPNERASRNLTLIAKTIQTLANFTQFGGKEEFMTFMNSFVERQAPHMKTFLHKISSREASNQFLEFDGYIDLGKELSVLQALLQECMDKYSETSGKSFEELNKMLKTLSNASEDPNVGQKKPNRKSQIYDNLVHISSPTKDVPQVPNKISYGPSKMKNMTASSPTEVLIDMLHHCGESTDDLPALANRGRPSESSMGSVEGTVSHSTQTSGASVSTTRTTTVREIGNVSVIGPRQVYNEHNINESWTQMVSAADNVNGDYIDLIPFVDEDGQNSSLELEGNTTGSQVSISQLSTVASSGYQSFSHSHSQSNSPIDSSSAHPQQGQELTRELTRSPIIHYQPNQSPQPLAFANPLFRHQQQQHQQQQPPARAVTGITSGRTVAGTHHGIPYSRAKTVQRVSSDSSLSSDEAEAGKSKASSAQIVKTTAVSSTASSDYQSTIAPLKKLSQLPSSSSEESLNGQSVTSSRSGSSTQHSSSSSSFVHSTSSNFISQQSSSKNCSVMSSLANSSVNGCSTFPRRHRAQPDPSAGNEVSPPLPPREAFGTTSSSSTPVSHRAPNFHRQMSNPSQPTSVGVQSSRQPSRLFPARAGITTNKTGHVQQRKFSGPKPGFLTSDTEGNNQSKAFGSQHGTSASPAIPARGFHSVGSGNNSASYTSPATHRAGNNRNSNNNTTTTTSITTAISGSYSSSTVSHKPPASNNTTTTSTCTSSSWQMAHHVERSSSSHETSSSSDSSPQSLVRSAQNNTSSMHESSSAQSISSAPSSSQAWGYTPSHSDSNSSLSSLTKTHQRGPVRSDSSGSLGGVNVSRISQTPSDSNSSVNSGNNNTGNGLTSSANSNQLDNRSHYQNHPNPTAFNTRLSSISDSQINNISLQNNPLPSPPAFLTSKYAVVHPHSATGVGSPRSERSTAYHSNPESAAKSGSSSRTAYTVSRSMDLGYLSKQRGETIKRASTDSTLSQPLEGMSPTGPPPSWPQSRDESVQSGSSANAANRRLSPQSTVHMGISSVQRKLQEQERTKQEYEQEVHVLRQQLLEAQERLQQAEMRLLDHEFDTHKLMDEWQNRLVESEEKMRRQQAEKDEQMKTIISRLQTIEEELKKEQAEMASAVEHKQQVIEVQEQRIRKLDEANGKLLQALADLKGRAARAAAAQSQDENSNTSSTCNGLSNTAEIAGFKTSSC